MLKICCCSGGLGGSDPGPQTLNRSPRVRVCARARVRGHWGVDFFSNQLASPALQGTRRGLQRVGGPVNTGRPGSLGGGARGLGAPPVRPALCNLRGNTAEGGASKTFLPGGPGPALPGTGSGAAPSASVSGTASAASSRAEPRPKEPAAGSAAPFRPPAPEPTLGPPGSGRARSGRANPRQRLEKGRSAAAETRAAPRERRLPVSGPPGGTAPVSRLVRAWGTRPPPPSRLQPGLRPGGRPLPTSLSPADGARRGRARGPGAARRPPHPTRRPGSSSRPLSPATFRALFSGWK